MSDTEYKKQIGAMLLRLRSEQGMTMEEIAGHVGESKTNWYRWESGRFAPTGIVLLKLSELIKKPIVISPTMNEAPTPLRKLAQMSKTEFHRNFVNPSGDVFTAEQIALIKTKMADRRGFHAMLAMYGRRADTYERLKQEGFDVLFTLQ